MCRSHWKGHHRNHAINCGLYVVWLLQACMFCMETVIYKNSYTLRIWLRISSLRIVNHVWYLGYNAQGHTVKKYYSLGSSLSSGPDLWARASVVYPRKYSWDLYERCFHTKNVWFLWRETLRFPHRRRFTQLGKKLFGSHCGLLIASCKIADAEDDVGHLLAFLYMYGPKIY